MDGVGSLLHEAHAAGLSLWREADQLVIEGPRRADGIARQLLESKAEVLAVLDSASQPAPSPSILDRLRFAVENGRAKTFESFDLRPGIRIENPTKFIWSLLTDLETEGPRWRFGVAQADLEDLRRALRRLAYL